MPARVEMVDLSARSGRSRTFLAGVLTLATGTAIAQAIPVAVSPILTRIYSPRDLGLLTLFLVVTTAIGVVSSGRYELAIMLPDDDADAQALGFLGILIAAVVSTALLIATIVAPQGISKLLGNEAVAAWLPLAAPTVFFIGVFNCLNYLATRQAEFRAVAVANVTKASVGAGTQVVLGMVITGPAGLIIGYCASTASANLALLRRFLLLGRRAVSWQRIKLVARRYVDFPKYSVGSALAQTANLALVAVLLTHLYSLESLGDFALVQRVLGVPLTLVAGSVGQVYFQRASEEKREHGDFRRIFVLTLSWLAPIAAGTTLILYIVLPTAFSLVFGEQWSSAGQLARNLLPGFAAQFVVAPLSLSNQLNLRNRLGLIGNLTVLAVMAAVLLLAAESGASVDRALLLMSVSQACYYLIFLCFIYRHVAAAREDGPNS